MAPGVKFWCRHDWHAKEHNRRTIQFENGKYYRLEHCRKCGSLDWRRCHSSPSVSVNYTSPIESKFSSDEVLIEWLRADAEERKKNPYRPSLLILPDARP